MSYWKLSRSRDGRPKPPSRDAVALEKVIRTPVIKLSNGWAHAGSTPISGGPWRKYFSHIEGAIKALESGGAFICARDRPSPYGTKYVLAFRHALAGISEGVKFHRPDAYLKLWFAWDWPRGEYPSRLKNAGEGDRFSEEYEGRLEEAHKLRLEMARLIEDGQEKKAKRLIERLKRKKIPAHVVADWITCPPEPEKDERCGDAEIKTFPRVAEHEKITATVRDAAIQA